MESLFRSADAHGYTAEVYRLLDEFALGLSHISNALDRNGDAIFNFHSQVAFVSLVAARLVVHFNLLGGSSIDGSLSRSRLEWEVRVR